MHSLSLGAVDSVTSGVLLEPQRLAALQAKVNKAYRRAMRIPRWAPTAFLHEPHPIGGARLPRVDLQNVVRLALTYVRASSCRNPLIRHATSAMAHLSHPSGEAATLSRRLEALGSTLHPLPDPGVDPAPLHI